jgi:hypothetical protein
MFLFPQTEVPEAVSSEVKRQGHEADHSLPPSAEVKNGGAILPLPHVSSWCPVTASSLGPNMSKSEDYCLLECDAI